MAAMLTDAPAAFSAEMNRFTLFAKVGSRSPMLRLVGNLLTQFAPPFLSSGRRRRRASGDVGRGSRAWRIARPLESARLLLRADYSVDQKPLPLLELRIALRVCAPVMPSTARRSPNILFKDC